MTKPVYAIPGNHDWYDALEAFAATFLEPARRARGDARACRVGPAPHEHDRPAHRQSSSSRPAGCASNTACRQASSARPSSRSRPTEFALICRRHRRRQERRSRAAGLAARRARSCARQDHHGGPRASVLRRRQRLVEGYESFAALKRLLLERDVAIVMAGDTHDLEYTVEPRPAGTADSPLRQRRRRRVSQLRHRARVARRSHASADWAYYPNLRAVTAKIRGRDAMVEAAGVVVDDASSARGRSRPNGSRPRSTTTSRLSSRASSRCASSAHPTACCLRPCGIHGRLTWGDMASSRDRPTRRASLLRRWSSGQCRWGDVRSGRSGRAVELGRSAYETDV